MTPCNEKQRVSKRYAEFLTYEPGNEALICVTHREFLGQLSDGHILAPS
jgi:hypothetical protein